MALRKDWLAQGGLPTDTIKGCFCLATNARRPGARTRSRQPPPTQSAARLALASADAAFLAR